MTFEQYFFVRECLREEKNTHVILHSPSASESSPSTSTDALMTASTFPPAPSKDLMPLDTMRVELMKFSSYLLNASIGRCEHGCWLAGTDSR